MKMILLLVGIATMVSALPFAETSINTKDHTEQNTNKTVSLDNYIVVQRAIANDKLNEKYSLKENKDSFKENERKNTNNSREKTEYLHNFMKVEYLALKGSLKKEINMFSNKIELQEQHSRQKRQISEDQRIVNKNATENSSTSDNSEENSNHDKILSFLRVMRENEKLVNTSPNSSLISIKYYDDFIMAVWKLPGDVYRVRLTERFVLRDSIITRALESPPPLHKAGQDSENKFQNSQDCENCQGPTNCVYLLQSNIFERCKYCDNIMDCTEFEHCNGKIVIHQLHEQILLPSTDIIRLRFICGRLHVARHARTTGETTIYEFVRDHSKELSSNLPKVRFADDIDDPPLPCLSRYVREVNSSSSTGKDNCEEYDNGEKNDFSNTNDETNDSTTSIPQTRIIDKSNDNQNGCVDENGSDCSNKTDTSNNSEFIEKSGNNAIIFPDEIQYKVIMFPNSTYKIMDAAEPEYNAIVFPDASKPHYNQQQRVIVFPVPN